MLACLHARFKRAALGRQDDKPKSPSRSAETVRSPLEGLTPVAVNVEEEIETIAWVEYEGAGRIPLHGTCTFGRVKGNTVVLPTDKVSRRHAMIHEQDGEFWLVDLGSTNGVEVNGDRVTHPVCLREGDRIQMSGHSILFRKPEKPAPPRRAPAF